tara:strand:- start:15 stop:290 length:276 start_codon:yes stop_codon:yes gene_type:complete
MNGLAVTFCLLRALQESIRGEIYVNSMSNAKNITTQTTIFELVAVWPHRANRSTVKKNPVIKRAERPKSLVSDVIGDRIANRANAWVGNRT